MKIAEGRRSATRTGEEDDICPRRARSSDATPYQSGVNLSRALEAVLITYQGVQHGVVNRGVACVDVPVLRYLTDLTLPSADLSCTAGG
ncbi:alpha/beta hydrolase [Nocardia sp. NPDC057455]|uniref:alpha/beta hydrolase n=1 Tax=Nocardia sp. NPDC057455 TaxID=3346138 RepID=UPI00366FCC55